MTEYSLPQQLTTVGDSTRAPYDADEWAFDHDANLAGYAARANHGAVFGYDDGLNYSLQVRATAPVSANVTLTIGSGAIRGTVYVNDAPLTLAIAPNVSGNQRIDAVILRKDYVAHTIRAAVKQGAPAATPVPPAMTQSDGATWEVPIAYIYVDNGFTTLNDGDIIPGFTWANSGQGSYIFNILNNSGADLYTGDLVVWDATTDRAVTTSTIGNDGLVAGFWAGYTPDGEYGTVQIAGITVANAENTTYATGVQVVSGTVAGKVQRSNTIGNDTVPPSWYSAGTVLADFSGGGGRRRVLLNIDIKCSPYQHYIAYPGTADRGTFTSGAWQNRFLNSAAAFLTDRTGISLPYIFINGDGRIVLESGYYYVDITAPAYRVDTHQARLFNFSDGTVELLGTGEYSPSAADSSQTRSSIRGHINLSSQKVFTLQHQCQTTRATDGLGNYPSFGAGAVAVYEEGLIIRLGEYR